MTEPKHAQAKQETSTDPPAARGEPRHRREAKGVQLPPKLLIIGIGFLASTSVFAYALRRTLSTFTLSKEALLGALPVLLLLFLTASLLIIFALLVQREVLALGLFGVLIAAVLFVLPFTSLPLLWRGIVALITFLGFLFLCSQARKTHEAYTGFSAPYYKGVVRNFFLLFVFILGIVLYFSTSQALEQKFEIPGETLKPAVSYLVDMVGGMLKQQAGRKVPEAQLAPYVEEQLVQLLQQMGLKLKLKGKPKSLAQVTTRVTRALKPELDKMIAPFKIYIPFVVAGMVVLTLFSLVPFVGLIGASIFFAVYRFLILVRLLKFEEVERTVKRLALA